MHFATHARKSSFRSFRHTTFAALALLLLACGSTDGKTPASSGGAAGASNQSGGKPSGAGGALQVASGGTSSTAGGATSSANGGSSNGGSGATSGGRSSGGATNGGKANSGGSTSGGKANSGGAASGGKAGSAGAAGSASGGAQDPGFTTDPDGWTVFQRSSSSVSYYVSSSSGRDANDGRSEGSAVQTLEHGMSLMKAGDWLLLKRGDTFNAPLTAPWRNGASANARTVIGAYGPESSARPIVDPQGGDGIAFTGGTGMPATLEHFAITSIHFRQGRRDPASPNFQRGAGNCGLLILREGQDVFLEDLLIEKFGNGIMIDAQPGLQKNFTLRRSVIMDNYNVDPEHAQGILMGWTQGVLIEQNVFDRNGQYPNVEGAYPTVFNHNLYIDSDHVGFVVVRDNILSRAASNGFQLRPAGLAEGNVLIGNGIAGFVSNSNLMNGDVQILRNNVALHAGMHRMGENGNDGTRGWGLALIDGSGSGQALPDVEATGNIVAHGATGADDAFVVEDPYPRVGTISNNVVYDWGGRSDAGPFVDPNRSIPSYQASLSQPQTIEAFLDQARQQRRGRWYREYTAPVVRAYFAAGFARR